jgi:hypothetical protein
MELGLAAHACAALVSKKGRNYAATTARKHAEPACRGAGNPV